MSEMPAKEGAARKVLEGTYRRGVWHKNVRREGAARARGTRSRKRRACVSPDVGFVSLVVRVGELVRRWVAESDGRSL